MLICLYTGHIGLAGTSLNIPVVIIVLPQYIIFGGYLVIHLLFVKNHIICHHVIVIPGFCRDEATLLKIDFTFFSHCLLRFIFGCFSNVYQVQNRSIAIVIMYIGGRICATGPVVAAVGQRIKGIATPSLRCICGSLWIIAQIALSCGNSLCGIAAAGQIFLAILQGRSSKYHLTVYVIVKNLTHLHINIALIVNADIGTTIYGENLATGGADDTTGKIYLTTLGINILCQQSIIIRVIINLDIINQGAIGCLFSLPAGASLINLIDTPPIIELGPAKVLIIGRCLGSLYLFLSYNGLVIAITTLQNTIYINGICGNEDSIARYAASLSSLIYTFAIGIRTIDSSRFMLVLVFHSPVIGNTVYCCLIYTLIYIFRGRANVYHTLGIALGYAAGFGGQSYGVTIHTCYLVILVETIDNNVANAAVIVDNLHISDTTINTTGNLNGTNTIKGLIDSFGMSIAHIGYLIRQGYATDGGIVRGNGQHRIITVDGF